MIFRVKRVLFFFILRIKRFHELHNETIPYIVVSFAFLISYILNELNRHLLIWLNINCVVEFTTDTTPILRQYFSKKSQEHLLCLSMF